MAFSSSALASASVLPRMWALRKFAASISAEVGSPTGRLRIRFSTWPSSATRTTSARSGSSRTNSMCLRRRLDLAVSTTPAARGQAREQPGRFGQHAFDGFAGPAATCAFDGTAVLVGQIADLHQGIDEEPQAELGRQPSGRGMGRIDQPSCSRSGMTLRTEAGDSVIGDDSRTDCASRPARRSPDSFRRSGEKSRASAR